MSIKYNISNYVYLTFVLVASLILGISREFKETVLYRAFEDLSHVTGANLFVDRGWTAW